VAPRLTTAGSGSAEGGSSAPSSKKKDQGEGEGAAGTPIEGSTMGGKALTSESGSGGRAELSSAIFNWEKGKRRKLRGISPFIAKEGGEREVACPWQSSLRHAARFRWRMRPVDMAQGKWPLPEHKWAGEGADRRAQLTWREGGRWLSSGPGPNPFLSMGTTCKMAKLTFPNSKNYQIFWGGRINKLEQLSFWEQIQIENGF
jgi:hypothetical protein